MKKTTASRSKTDELTAILTRRLQEGGFILLSAVAIFLFVALLTYSDADPGWSHGTTQKTILNAAGRTGAWLSDVFFYLFGYVAYLFPSMIGYGGIRLFQNRFEVEKFHRLLWSIRIIGFTLALIAGCGLATMHFNEINKSVLSNAGGITGQILRAKLIPSFGYLGATLLLMSFFLAGITLATGLSWFGLMDVIRQSLFNGIGWIKIQIAYCGIRYKEWRHQIRLSSEKKVKSIRRTPIMGGTTDPIPLPNALALPLPSILKPEKKQKIQARLPSDESAKMGLILPSVTLLEAAEKNVSPATFSKSKLESLSREVEARLLEFGIQVTVVAVYPGPVITRFEMELAAGLKVSKISGLAKDLARALSVTRVRVVEVIPGKSVVGLEIPNEHRELVRLREILESSEYAESTSPLTLALGKDIAGIPVVVNLAKMPHLLVAGTTGSGKSVGINVMLLNLLYKATPEEIRLILIDPKMLELSIYDGIPHLLTPVVTDMKDAANALRWCVAEMERRYQLMAAVGVRNLVGYNRKITDAEQEKAPLLDPLWQPAMGGERPELTRLPHIVVIIDEFADMMMVVGKKVEELIARIAQKARAAGIHMILATQRPSVDVITGLIKANVPTRIAFQVSSRIDSRTILDQQGAEQLLGHGDMLYLPPGTGIPTRIHGAFVSDEEVHAVVKVLKQLGEPDFVIDVLGGGQGYPGFGSLEGEENDGEQDEHYDQAVKIVIESRRASISNLQRRLKIGYNRAARLIETMEAAGIVSSVLSNGSREILVGESHEER